MSNLYKIITVKISQIIYIHIYSIYPINKLIVALYFISDRRVGYVITSLNYKLQINVCSNIIKIIITKILNNNVK